MTEAKTVIIPSNPADQKTILDAVKEADVALISIATYRAQIKEIVEELAEKFPDIDKKFFRKMISTYHKQNFTTVVTETEEFTDLYNTIVK